MRAGSDANKKTSISPEWITVMLLTTGYWTWNLIYQQRIGTRGGAGFDGVAYLDMAYGRPAGLPYRLRIAYPWLAGAFAGEGNPLEAFHTMSVLLAFLCGPLSFWALRRFVPKAQPSAVLLGWAALNFSELGFSREAFWYPANTDTPAEFIFLLLAVVLLTQAGVKRSLMLCTLMFCGTVVRENFCFNALWVLLIDLIDPHAPVLVPGRWRAWIMSSGACAIGIGLAMATVHAATGDWVFNNKTSIMWFWLQKFGIPARVEGFFAIYGFAIVAALAAMPYAKTLRVRHWHATALFTCGTVGVALVGGGDFERFLYWYLPAVLLLVLPCIDALVRHRDWVALTLAGGTYAFWHRPFVPTGPHMRAAACRLDEYIAGASPFLGGYARMCQQHLAPLINVAALFLTATIMWAALRHWRLLRARSADYQPVVSAPPTHS